MQDPVRQNCRELSPVGPVEGTVGRRRRRLFAPPVPTAAAGHIRRIGRAVNAARGAGGGASAGARRRGAEAGGRRRTRPGMRTKEAGAPRTGPGRGAA